ncbi:hypothetical protein BD324DRAFT_634430 [Kockovaella imperatae]|uniref:Uncharacterized protein n=1 Tax=Kockovaella imperatae TaxID=4999 RepID=A0A1Y1U9G1_9TREE|nr:hypothetical protein BD324DRAFT_634430 [Kockovaella imperatae]ORX34668.1 hypothetical protein BD324DRAFT_634430 [Kockovaella imperatae]
MLSSTSISRLMDSSRVMWGYLLVFALGYGVANIRRLVGSGMFQKTLDLPSAHSDHPLSEKEDRSEATQDPLDDRPASQLDTSPIRAEANPQNGEISADSAPSTVNESVEPASTKLWADDNDWGQSVTLRSVAPPNVEDSRIGDHNATSDQQTLPSVNKSETFIEEDDGGWGLPAGTDRSTDRPCSQSARGHIVPTQIKSKSKHRASSPEKQPGRWSRTSAKSEHDLCPICVRPVHPKHLQEHNRDFHPAGTTAPRGTAIAETKCQVCLMELPSSLELRKHVDANHSWAYLCSSHLVRFRDAQLALEHYRDVHYAHGVTFNTIEVFLGSKSCLATTSRPDAAHSSSSAWPTVANAQRAADDATKSANPNPSSLAQAEDVLSIIPSFGLPSQASSLYLTGSSAKTAAMDQPEPATAPLTCMNCQKVFPDHPDLARHALYPCTRFTASYLEQQHSYTNNHGFSHSHFMTSSQFTDQDNQDLSNSYASLPSEGVDTPILTPGGSSSTSNDELSIISPDPLQYPSLGSATDSATAHNLSSTVPSEASFSDEPSETFPDEMSNPTGKTPDDLQRDEFTSSNRWDTGPPSFIPPPHCRADQSDVTSAMARRQQFHPGRGVPDIPYEQRPPQTRWRRPGEQDQLLGTGIEVQIPSFGLPGKGEEFHPFGPPAQSPAVSQTVSHQSSTRASDASGSSTTNGLSLSHAPSSASTPVSPQNPRNSLSRDTSSKLILGTSRSWSSDASQPMPALPNDLRHLTSLGAPSEANARPLNLERNLRDIAAGAPTRSKHGHAQSNRSSKKIPKTVVQPIFDSGWESVTVQPSIRGKGGKVTSDSAWGGTLYPSAGDGDDQYGGW